MTSTPNLDRFSGLADPYDRHRPQPPPVLADLLTRCLGGPPATVVDLGSGTGLSTRFWSGRAGRVIGVEPNADMRARAEAVGGAGLEYRSGTAAATGLPAGCADLVTISQAFHWMDPQPTLAETARLLRPGGVLAVYDCDWPPAVHWEVEAAHDRLMAEARRLEDAGNRDRHFRRWPKERHLENIRASGHFRYAREVLLHHEEAGDAERFIGLVHSQGTIADLLRCGVAAETFGLPEFEALCRRELAGPVRPWLFSYRVRLGFTRSL
jgi:SAM-dependent methyltransferase